MDHRAIAIIGEAAVEAQLTTEHSASSYGLPVMVAEGQVYGPAEVQAVIIAREWPRHRPADVQSQNAEEALQAAKRAGYRAYCLSEAFWASIRLPEIPGLCNAVDLADRMPARS